MSTKRLRDKADDFPSSTREEFDLARGRAISQYAHLEVTLCDVFSIGFDTHEGTLVHHRRSQHAIFVFYKIMNSRSRNEILRRVVAEKVLLSSELFRKTLFTELRNLDEFRNKLAHWEVNQSVGSDGKNRHFLVPPRRGIEAECYAPSEIFDWLVRVQFSVYLFNLLRYSATGNFPEWASQYSCEQIFQQRVVYPPVSDHPLRSVWQGPTAKSK